MYRVGVRLHLRGWGQDACATGRLAFPAELRLERGIETATFVWHASTANNPNSIAGEVQLAYGNGRHILYREPFALPMGVLQYGRRPDVTGPLRGETVAIDRFDDFQVRVKVPSFAGELKVRIELIVYYRPRID